MTGKKFLIYSFFLLTVFTILKIWFFNYDIFSEPLLQSLVLWLAVAVLAVAITRRFGVISYLEAIFLMIAWTASGLFIDLLVTASFFGITLFYQPEFWISYLFMDLAIFLFHKKRHIFVRHELRAKEHAKH